MILVQRSKLYIFNALLALFLSACSSNPPLMPTPNVYTNNQYSEENIPVSLRKSHMDLLYVTDRKPSLKKNEHYSSERSDSMAYGIARVGFQNKSIKWDKLLVQSNQKRRSEKLVYSMEQTNELGRFPDSPYIFKRTANGMQIDESVLNQKTINEKKLSDNIRERLKKSESKDVILFVHGFNNTFKEAVFTLSGIWHFLERQGVPLVYTWPAAKGGLTGYFVDSESGEFTIFHLKETLRLLFKIPEIENVHIIAHSRGTDVVSSTLRELIIENRAKGGNPRKDFRIENLILAAPDLDFGIIKQRLMAEQFGTAFGQITIYTSQGDSALGLSQWLTNGLRFGLLKARDIDVNEQAIFAAVGNVSLIKAPKSKGFIGHDYFHSDPAVSSDIVNLITHNALPGSKERPLTKVENNFWEIKSNYLRKN